MIETYTVGLAERAKVVPETRTLSGVVVPYGETTFNVAYAEGERFLPGAFKGFLKQWNKRGGQRRPIHLFRSHQHDRAIGVATSLTETDEGLIGEFRIAASQYGDEAIAEVRDEMLTAMSVGFRTNRAQFAEDGAREIVEAELVEASLVVLPAYEGAKVLAVRKPATLVVPRLPAPPRVSVGGWLG